MSRLIKVASWSGGKTANVIFVHGLGGHPYDTWRSTQGDGDFWPYWLAEDVPGIMVFTLNYEAPASNWLGTAMPLNDQAANVLQVLLAESELRSGPIVFVCHSLGGLVVKQLLRRASEQRASSPSAASLLKQTRVVIFLSTPHTGSAVATLAEKLRFFVWPSSSTKDLVANDPGIREINIGYRTLASDRGKQLRHLAFYEMADVGGARVVDPASGDPGLPNCTPTPVLADHMEISKPSDRGELVYLQTRDLVKSLGEPNGIPGVLTKFPFLAVKRNWRWKQVVPRIIRIVPILSIVAIGLGSIPGIREFITHKLGISECYLFDPATGNRNSAQGVRECFRGRLTFIKWKDPSKYPGTNIEKGTWPNDRPNRVLELLGNVDGKVNWTERDLDQINSDGDHWLKISHRWIEVATLLPGVKDATGFILRRVDTEGLPCVNGKRKIMEFYIPDDLDRRIASNGTGRLYTRWLDQPCDAELSKGLISGGPFDDFGVDVVDAKRD